MTANRPPDWLDLLRLEIDMPRVELTISNAKRPRRVAALVRVFSALACRAG